MRTLASIKEIAALHPIEGKDRIELAVIDGWSVIVKKNEFQVGDRCVYCEIDSVLPEKPEFEFLRNKNFRIKTMKMGGVISQGICFPLSILPESEYKVGDDVTDIMGVKQYEPTIVPFPVSWTVKMKKKQKETQDILSYHSQAAGCSDKARAKASGGRQPIEECGRTGL